MLRPTIFEAIGGESAFLALAAAHHQRCLDDPVLNHPFSHPGHKDIVDPAAFIDEAQGLARIGVTWLAFHLPAPSVAEFCATVEAFGEAVTEVQS